MVVSVIKKYSYLEDAPVNTAALPLEITLLEYLDIWLEQKKTEVETATYESYQYRSRGIVRFFEKYYPGIKLRDVSSAVLSRFFTYQLKHGKISPAFHTICSI